LKAIPAFWDMNDQNIINALEGMVNQGIMRVNERGNFEAVLPGADFFNTYIFTANTALKDCLTAYDILFEKFNIVPPSTCASCWKVVVHCKTVYEMFQIWSAMKEQGIPGKAGTDEREFAGGFYHVFAYNASMEEGRAKWCQMVRLAQEAAGGHFMDDYMKTVILKRGCTEMEGRLPSINWRVPEAQLEFEQKVADLIEPMPLKIAQPEWLIAHKMRRWCTKAHMIGDMSYKELEPITGPINFGVKSLTYHQKEWLDDENVIQE